MISAVLPCFTVNEELKNMALDCAKRIRDQVDELIITEDSDVYWPELQQISDIYMLHPRLGYLKNCNLGWRVASGDFVLHINSDALYLEGKLQDLCVNGIGIPQCIETGNEWHTSTAMSGFFMVPKSVYQRLGGWDEKSTPDGTWSPELFDRYRIGGVEFIGVRMVRISHPRAGATSYRSLGDYKGR